MIDYRPHKLGAPTSLIQTPSKPLMWNRPTDGVHGHIIEGIPASSQRLFPLKDKHFRDGFFHRSRFYCHFMHRLS